LEKTKGGDKETLITGDDRGESIKEDPVKNPMGKGLKEMGEEQG